MNEFSRLKEALDDGVETLRQRACLLARMTRQVSARNLEELEEAIANGPDFHAAERQLTTTVRDRCRSLASVRGLDPELSTLSELIQKLDGREAMQLRERRQRLVFAVDQVHEKARALMRVASRARAIEERVLLAALGPVDDTGTYQSDGEMSRSQPGLALQHKA
jgi:hypothetical protein